MDITLQVARNVTNANNIHDQNESVKNMTNANNILDYIKTVKNVRNIAF